MTINAECEIDFLGGLTQIDESTNLYDLVSESCRPTAKKVPPPMSSFHQSLFSYTSKPIAVAADSAQTEQVKKAKWAFSKVIGKWRDALSNHYWKVQLAPQKLEGLQHYIQGIIDAKKLEIVTQKLNDLNIKSKTLHESIAQLELEMTRIASAPLIKELKRERNSPIYFLHLPPRDEASDPPSLKCKETEKGLFRRSRSETNISLLTRGPLIDDEEKTLSEGEESTFDDDRDILNEIEARIFIKQYQKQLRNWQIKFSEAFLEIACPQKIGRIAKAASFEQLEVLIDSVLCDETRYWRLGHLIEGLELKNLNALIYQSDEHKLKRINEIISNDRYTDIPSIQRYFAGCVKKWIKQCNQMKIPLDEFCDDLRFNHLTGATLSWRELDTIQSYTKEVEALLCISTKIEDLIEGVVTNVEWLHVSSNGIRKVYPKYLTRLTEKHEYQDRESGCVWGIIYRLAFERVFSAQATRGVKIDYDDKNATEMFPDWLILESTDFREIGLLGDISNESFAQIEHDKQRMKEVVKAVLDRLGIEKVKHWKQKQIFNRNFFKEYLMKEEVRSIVNDKVAELLT